LGEERIDIFVEIERNRHRTRESTAGMIKKPAVSHTLRGSR
jgi:hypothetical protein